MSSNTPAEEQHQPRSRCCLRRAGTAVAVALLAIGATACSATSAPAPSSLQGSPSATTRPPAGIGCASTPAMPRFSAPAGQGESLLPSSANQASGNPCGTSNPNGNVIASPNQSMQSALLRFARCMRAHGITNFPEPSTRSSGPATINSNGSINTSSHQFQEAQQACQSLLGSAGGIP